MDKNEIKSIMQDYFNDLPRLALQHSENDSNPLFNAIDKLIDMRLKELKFNKTETGVIKKDNGDGTYEVSFGASIRVLKRNENGEYNWSEEETKILPAISGMKYNINDVVYIEIVNNDYSCRYIKCKRPREL